MPQSRWSARASIALSLLAGTALLLSLLVGPAKPEATQTPPSSQQSPVAETPAPPETEAAPSAELASVTLPPPPAPAATTADPAPAAAPPTTDPSETSPESGPTESRSAESRLSESTPEDAWSPPLEVKPRKIAALQPDPAPPDPARDLPTLSVEPKRPMAEPPEPRAAAPAAPTDAPKVVQALTPDPEPAPRPQRQPTPDLAPKPKPQGTPAPAPEPAHKPVHAGEPLATAKPAAAPAEPVVAVSAHSEKGQRDGGVLLRLREHGSGPGVEIGWPRASAARGRLFDHMNRCLALRSAVMDGQGRLYVADPGGGTPGPGGSWRPDRDRYSGFVRQPRGYLAPAERALRGRLVTRHGLPASVRVVRLFPRTVDAALLSGLRRLLGTAYREAARITGGYRLSGDRLEVTDLRVDGRPVAGTITLAGGC